MIESASIYALGTALQLEHRYEDAATRLQMALALRADRPHYLLLSLGRGAPILGVF